MNTWKWQRRSRPNNWQNVYLIEERKIYCRMEGKKRLKSATSPHSLSSWYWDPKSCNLCMGLAYCFFYMYVTFDYHICMCMYVYGVCIHACMNGWMETVNCSELGRLNLLSCRWRVWLRGRVWKAVSSRRPCVKIFFNATKF